MEPSSFRMRIPRTHFPGVLANSTSLKKYSINTKAGINAIGKRLNNRPSGYGVQKGFTACSPTLIHQPC